VTGWLRSETCQTVIGKREKLSTYFFEEEERREERGQSDGRCGKTGKEIWVLFPEFSIEESWEAITRFCKASSYQWARYALMLSRCEEQTGMMTLPDTSADRIQDENQPETPSAIRRVRNFAHNALYDACDIS